MLDISTDTVVSPTTVVTSRSTDTRVSAESGCVRLLHILCTMLLWAVLAFLFRLFSRAASYASRQPEKAWSEWAKPPAWLYASAITTVGLFFKGTTVVFSVRFAIVKSNIDRSPSLARITYVLLLL